MAQSLLPTTTASRPQQVRLGIWIELVTVGWMIVEAAIALLVGYSTHSVSLQGFGIDSLIELLSGSILLWRLLIEARGGTLARVEQAERQASWVTAISLFALSLYIIAESALSLLIGTHAQASAWGIGLAVSAAIIMPVLWQSKLRVARRIGSAALKADAACSVTCAYMSLTLLVGLLLNRLLGWWWADALAALALVYFLAREGREALHEARTGESCACGEADCAGD
jgi:divalent metal cation (Fe/Co/Zn/Cd) transporter